METNGKWDVRAYLYDASGSDERVELDDVDVRVLDESKLLWVTILQRDAKMITEVASRLNIEDIPVRSVIEGSSRPIVIKFGEYFHFSVNSVMLLAEGVPAKYPIDFVVGKNFVVTIHDGEVEYFADLRQREKGETQFGRLSSESFVATLLDLHIVSYFHALDVLEKRVDKLDSRILKKELEADEFVAEMVVLRRDVSKLRRWLIPHRELIYSFLRADFQHIIDSGALELYKTLESHFENAVDAIESSRETVLGAFDLYATKSSQLTNVFIQRLTFLTLVTGTLGVIAGVLGMNYKAAIFDAENGFWIAIGIMVLVAVGLTIFARLKRWI
jgi:magnesium/cobalt transport protein CorA